MWNRVNPDPNAQCVTLMDLRGLNMRDLAGQAQDLVKGVTGIAQTHYVERSSRIFVALWDEFPLPAAPSCRATVLPSSVSRLLPPASPAVPAFLGVVPALVPSY